MQPGHGEFREAVDPACLLQQSPEMIWPGLMSCDLLPILGNTGGDWLCVRVDGDDRASQIVHWYHGGGDWIPWGNSLAEAIVFDALVDRLPGKTRRHAEPAEDPRPEPRLLEDPMLRWGLEHVPDAIGKFIQSPAEPHQIAQTLLDNHVAEVAVGCELVLENLMHSVSEMIVPALTRDTGLHRNQLAEWSFDLLRIPQRERQRLANECPLPLEELQDWRAAKQHSQRVAELAPELAWPWDILGYAAEREGDLETAKTSYRRAAQCSVFTDQSIRLQTYWTSPESAKFGVARLSYLSPEEIAESAYLKMLCDPDPKQRRIEITQYWRAKASRHLESDDPAEAHRCFTNAAWDVGAQSIPVYGELIEKIEDCARLSNQASRAEIARTHRRCLKDRYGE